MEIAYVRVSTYEQNLDLQREEIQRKYPLAEIREEKESSSRERPILNTVLLDLAAGKFDTLIIWRLDRLARSASELLRYAEVFRKSRINLISMREKIDLESAGGKLFFILLAAFAEFERDSIRDRVKSGVASSRKKNNGRWGRPKKVIDGELAHMYAAEGRSLREIAGLMGASRATVKRRLAEFRQNK